MSLDAHEMNIQTVRRLNEGLRVGPVVIVVNTRCRGVVVPESVLSPAVFRLLPGKVTYRDGTVSFEHEGQRCIVPFGAIVTVRGDAAPFSPEHVSAWLDEQLARPDSPAASLASRLVEPPAPVLRTRGHLRLIQGGRS